MNKSKFVRLAQFVIRITVIIILFGGSTTNGGVVFAQAASPARFHVQMVQNNVQGYDWPVEAAVTLTIDDPNTVGVDFTDTKTATSDPLSWDPDFTVVSFDNLGGITLAPGMLITMTNDTIFKYHTVTDIEVAGVDLGEDTVWGTGTPGANINVQYCDDSSGCVWRRWATVQPDGTWQVNFSIAGPGDDEQLILDILPGIIGEALEPDDDGDHTDYQWGVPNPTIGVRGNDNVVEGYDWPLGATVHVGVDDPATVQNPDYSGSAIVGIADWNTDLTWFSLSTGSYDLKVDDRVTATYEDIIKQYTVLNFAITEVDPNTDMVYGIGKSNQPMSVWACKEGPCVSRDEVVGGDGHWSANFAVPGNEAWEQNTMDIQFGTWVDSSMADEDGDRTESGLTVDWVAPPSIPLVFAISSPVDLSVPRATLENISVLNALNDSLFRLDQDANLQPLAASSYSVSQNGLVYTVTLRSGAVWTDGQPVTAQNYVDGILRVLDPEVGSDYGFLLFPIVNAEEFHNGSITNRNLVGVKALNSLTLEFTIKQPATHFPQILASPVMLPARQDVIDQYGANWTSPAHFVSNGLYKLAEYDAGHIVIEKIFSTMAQYKLFSHKSAST